MPELSNQTIKFFFPVYNRASQLEKKDPLSKLTDLGEGIKFLRIETA